MAVQLGGGEARSEGSKVRPWRRTELTLRAAAKALGSGALLALWGWSTLTLTAEAHSDARHGATLTEQWVAQRLASGQSADLSLSPSGAEISGAFLSLLIQDQIPATPLTTIGVAIAHAVVVGPVIIDNADIAHVVLLFNCAFKDPFSAVSARFERSLSFNRSKFSQELDLNSVRVTDGLSLKDGTFEEVDLIGSNVGGQLQLSGAHAFSVSLEYATVAGLVEMDYLDVANGLRLGGAELGSDLYVQSSTFGSDGVADDWFGNLAINGTRVAGGFTIVDTAIQSFLAEGLRVSGPTEFDGVTIKSSVNLANAEFNVISMAENVALPSDSTKIHISGMTFQSLSGDWQPLYRLIQAAPYDAGAYGQMQTELDRRGDINGASQVLWDHQHRERALLLTGGPPAWPMWTLNLMQGYSSNYGRDPLRPLALGLVVVLAGGLLFRRRVMKPAVTSADLGGVPDRYSPLAYSIGILVPGLHLEVTDRWQPATAPISALRYVFVVLGWIITALVLATLSGIIPKP